VTVEQRLGVFGYMALPQLSKEQGQSGNYGLMDEVKALEWVRDNIAAFGGDPTNITCGGQSGGTSKSMALAISPKNTVPIKKLILESGLKWTVDAYQTQDAVQKKCQSFLQDIGVSPDASLTDLRKLDAKVLLAATSKNYPSSMTQDGLYITYPSVFDAVNAGKLDNISILSGTNIGEGTYQIASTADIFYGKYKAALGDLYDQYDFKSLVVVTDINAQQASRMLGTYGLGTNGSRDLMVNRLFGKLIAQRTNGKVKNYTYLFNHIVPESVSDIGTERAAANQWAYHSSEMWYAFNSIRPGVPAVRNWTAWDYELAGQMNTYWTNFIKTGDPNGKGLVTWPVADEGMGYIVLGDGISSHAGELTKLERLMQEYTTKYFKLQ
jgi:para-nitrobenzyl esterase